MFTSKSRQNSLSVGKRYVSVNISVNILGNVTLNVPSIYHVLAFAKSVSNWLVANTRCRRSPAVTSALKKPCGMCRSSTTKASSLSVGKRYVSVNILGNVTLNVPSIYHVLAFAKSVSSWLVANTRCRRSPAVTSALKKPGGMCRSSTTKARSDGSVGLSRWRTRFAKRTCNAKE